MDKKIKKIWFSYNNILLSSFVPKNEVWFLNENSFKFQKVKVFPKYVFRLFGRLIRIYIEKI